MITAEDRQLGRAKNALMFYLERHLIVPKIYLDANWGGHHVDILAIDRAGVGDVHAVLFVGASRINGESLDIEKLKLAVDRMIDQFILISANYKYIAIVNPDDCSLTEMSKIKINEKLFSPDGLGRIGFILLGSVTEADSEVKPVLLVKPERFRAKIAKLADEFVQKHEADWEIRA